MTYFNMMLSLLAVLGLAASAFGWRHSLGQRESSAEWYFAAAKALYSVGFGLRLILWDVIWGPLRDADPGVAAALAASMGGTDVNIVSSAIILAGCYCSLRARHLLIRPEDRDVWPWFLSWLHPKRPMWRR